MKTLQVKPVTGRTVRDPVKGDLLPGSGRQVDNTAFWRRRLRDGDVVQVSDNPPENNDVIRLV